MTRAKRTLLTWLAATALSLSACSSEDRPAAEPSPSLPPASTAPSTAVAEAEAEPTPEELPVAEDYEAEAERSVKPEDLRAQLDALEREINASTQR
jgi:TolA-binding protein